MKILFLIVSFFITSVTFAQKYTIGALQSMGNSIARTGSIDIKDSNVAIWIQLDSSKSIQEFKIKERRKNRLEITDGKKTHILIISETKGKLQGFKYAFVLKFLMDFGMSQPMVIEYYCNL